MKVMSKKCLWCGKQYYKKSNYSKRLFIKRSKYCSRSCRASYMNSQGIIGFKIGHAFFLGGERGWFRKGEKSWNSGKPILSMRGKNHPNWKGGSVRRDRGRVEYKNWRTSVFERDDYTCQICGVRGGYLQVDHIKPWSLFPNLRFELDNGRTLCRDCHRKTPTYGDLRNYKPVAGYVV